jgi:2'-5' RNA ligase
VRLFVAVWPPPEVVRALASLDRPPLAGVRWTAPEHWHVTLRFLGELPDPEEAIGALGSAGLERLEPPVVLLGPVTEVLGSHVLCLPARGLDEAAAVVASTTARIGRPPERRPFHGHLTLARAVRGGARTLRRVAGTGFEARFSAERITLVASVLGRTGPRYEVLESYPLGSRFGPRPAR